MHRAHDLETPAGLTLLSFGLSQPKAYLQLSTVYFLKSGFFGIFHRGGVGMCLNYHTHKHIVPHCSEALPLIFHDCDPHGTGTRHGRSQYIATNDLNGVYELGTLPVIAWLVHEHSC